MSEVDKDLENGLSPTDIARLARPDADTDDENASQYMASLLPVWLRNMLIREFTASPDYPNSPVVFDILEDRVLELGVQLPPEGKILTLGAGDGQMELNLAQRGLTGPQIIATDKIPHFEVAQGIAQAQGLSNISFEAADARQLHYPDNQVDLVVAPFFIYHLKNPERVVQEVYRVLKPGGTGIISSRGVMHMKSIWDSMQIVADELNEFTTVGFEAPQSWYKNCPPSKTRQLLEEVGFTDVRSTFVQRSPDDYLYIPSSRWDDFRSAVVLAWKDSFKPVPPTTSDLNAIIEGPIRDGFFAIAEEHNGYFPLEVDQEVFEFRKPVH